MVIFFCLLWVYAGLFHCSNVYLMSLLPWGPVPVTWDLVEIFQYIEWNCECWVTWLSSIGYQHIILFFAVRKDRHLWAWNKIHHGLKGAMVCYYSSLGLSDVYCSIPSSCIIESYETVTQLVFVEGRWKLIHVICNDWRWLLCTYLQ